MRGEDRDMFLGFGGSDSDYNKFFRYHQKKEKFPVPIINLLNSNTSDTGSKTFFWYQFFRYRFRPNSCWKDIEYQPFAKRGTDVERRNVEIAAECHSIPINTIYKTNTRDTVFKDFQIYFICGHKVQAGQWSYIIYFGEGSIYNLVNSLINAIIVHHCAWLARTE